MYVCLIWHETWLCVELGGAAAAAAATAAVTLIMQMNRHKALVLSTLNVSTVIIIGKGLFCIS
jgi:hypothetical protein